MQHSNENLQTIFSKLASDYHCSLLFPDSQDYVLGLIFYKAVSDNVIREAYSLVNHGYVVGQRIDLNEAQNCYEQAMADEAICGDLTQKLLDKLGYVIKPELTFAALNKKVQANEFQLEHLREAFKELDSSDNKTYQGIFSGLNFDQFAYNSSDSAEKLMNETFASSLLSSIIASLATVDFSLYSDTDLSESYELLNEELLLRSRVDSVFYPPKAVAELMARLVISGKENEPEFSVYDPCCGSGTLMLHVGKCLGLNSNTNKTIELYGQEVRVSSYNLARMNMMLNNVSNTCWHLNNGNTLAQDWPNEGQTKFDACVMNPPYAQKYSADKSLLDDPRFSKYGVLPPYSKADYAFLLHGLYHLKDDGTMAIMFPHGVLSRGASEGKIRKALLDEGSIYAVIGLPAGILFKTSIPTCIIVLKKNHTSKDVLFIDASQEFQKKRATIELMPEHLDKIFKSYQERTNVEQFAYLASYEEIVANDYSLNITNYVDATKPAIQVDLSSALASLAQAQIEDKEIDKKLDFYLNKLELNLKGGR